MRPAIKKFWAKVAIALNENKEEKVLSQQIIRILTPAFEQVLLRLRPWSEQSGLLWLFMKIGSEEQQLGIFNLLKELIIDEADEDLVKNAVELITDTLGVDHPWSQELIDLATKHQNSAHKNSPFSVYKQLCEQMDQPVEHHLPKFQLEDKRWVTFNLKTLQARRQPFCLPMTYDELVRFTKQLLLEADQYPEEFHLCATEALRLDRSIAMERVNTAFFKSLLDSDEEQKDVQRQSLTSTKLRHILTAAKGLQEQESKGNAVQGISHSSQLILSLLNNVLTCPTGKEDGIDQTYRLLTNRRGGSEQELQGERLREEMHEFFQEEMRCMRETLLSGNGPVVRSLLNPSITNEEELKKVKVEEAPHQAKYLGNLLGAEIGSFLVGKGVTFDQNGGCVSSELRKCNKQQALDKLYQYHKPEGVIRNFHERFNALGFKGKIDGKYTMTNIIYGLLTEEQRENLDYIVYDDFYIPQGLTPLAVAEILINTYILDVVEKD